MKNFVVISDIHSDRKLFNQINELLKEYEVVYILGDATDRGSKKDGTGGVEILLGIKELSEKYPGRVIYLPGNHDEFIIGSFFSRHKETYEDYMYYNGGKQTYKDLCQLKKQGKLLDLCEWLGNLPIQRSCTVNGQRYVLAHAVFNEHLYEIEPDYSLFDYFDFRGVEKDAAIGNKVHNVLWYRKYEYGNINVEELPLASSIMIVGHTAARDLPSSINLKDKNGNEIIVHCVDSGTMYNDPLLKYVSGKKKVEKIIVKDTKVNVPSVKINLPESCNVNGKCIDDGLSSKNILDVFAPVELSNKIMLVDVVKYILNRKKSSIIDNLKKIKNQIVEPWLYCVEKPLSDYMIDNYDYMKTIHQHKLDVFAQKIDGYNPQDNFVCYCDYVKTILLDYLIFNLIKKYDLECALENIDTFLFGTGGYVYCEDTNAYISADKLKGSYSNFTRDGYGREIAWALSADGIKRVLAIHGCATASEYIYNKLEKQGIYLSKEYSHKIRIRNKS